MPLSLTDAQLATVMRAAALLPPLARGGFLHSVAAVLGERERPSDGDVVWAARFVLSERGVAVGCFFNERRWVRHAARTVATGASQDSVRERGS
jgi:hypothetical protein